MAVPATDSTTLALTSEPVLQQSTSADDPQDGPEGVPQDPIRASMLNVSTVWEEWYVGLESLDGTTRAMSVVELDNRWPNGKWRYCSKLCTRYQNRKKLIDAINEAAGTEPSRIPQIIQGLDACRHSPDKIVRLLKGGSTLQQISQQAPP